MSWMKALMPSYVDSALDEGRYQVQYLKKCLVIKINFEDSYSRPPCAKGLHAEHHW